MKKNLRQIIQQRLAEIPEEDILRMSDRIMSRIESTEEFGRARIIALYWSFGSEVHTHDRIAEWSRTKTILLPVISGDTLLLKQFAGCEQMLPCIFGIPEPAGEAFDEGAVDMIVVPGLAFDRRGHRLGRGKGYYDRLLCTTDAVKFGVCFECQLFDTIPVELHDVRMDAVVTEKSFISDNEKFRK